jgi:hypothetical protein
VSEALFDVTMPEVTQESVDSAVKWTERMMLDAIHRRYSQRAGNGPRYVVAEHVRNQCGFGGDYFGTGPLRTADALAVDLWPSSGHLVHGFEVKVSRSDWLHELKDPEKAEAFKPYCDHWWLVVPDAAIVRDDLPNGWGLLVDGKAGLRIKKRAPHLEREAMPFEMTAAWLRAAAKTARSR